MSFRYDLFNKTSSRVLIEQPKVASKQCHPGQGMAELARTTEIQDLSEKRVFQSK